MGQLVAIIQLALVAVSIGLTVYQMMQAKKSKVQDNAAADARKGYEIVTEGQPDSLPIVYGRAKVGGVRVYHAVSSDFKYAEPNSDFQLLTGQKVQKTGTLKEIGINSITGEKEWVNRDWSYTSDTTLAKDHDEGARNEFLYFQQAMCLGPISRVLDMVIDDARYLDDPALGTYGSDITLKKTSYTAEEAPDKTKWDDKDKPRTALRVDLHYGGAALGDSIMAANFPDRGSATFPGIAYASAVFRIDRNDPQFTNVPGLQFLIEGRRVKSIIHDAQADIYTLGPRDYSNNPALCMLDYLLDTESGAGVDVSYELDLKSFYEASLICDTPVSATGEHLPNGQPAPVEVGGKIWQSTIGTIYETSRTLKLYECNIVIDTKRPVRDNIESILSSMGDARLVWSGGQYKLSLQYPFPVASEPNNPNAGIKLAGTLTDDDLVLDQKVDIAWPGASERLNYCTIKFHNEVEDFKEDSVSWPPKVNAKYPVGLGGIRYPLAEFSYDEVALPGRLLNKYGVWSGTLNTTLMTYWISIRDEDSEGTMTLNVAGDDSCLVKIFSKDGAQLYSLGGSLTTLGTNTSIILGAKSSVEGYTKYKITVEGGNATKDKAVAAELFRGSRIFWTTREPGYSGLMHVETDNRLYTEFLAEDNGILLETEAFSEGVTDYYHAYAKAQELVRTSRSAYTIKFKYIVNDKYFEPGDFVLLNSDTLNIMNKYFRINSVKMGEENTCEVSAQRFDASQLAWVQSPLEYKIPKALVDFGIAAPREIIYTPGATGVVDKFGTVSWIGDARIANVKYYVYISLPIVDGEVPEFKLLGITENTFLDIDKPLSGSVFFKVVAYSGTTHSAPGLSSTNDAIDMHPSEYTTVGFSALQTGSTVSWGIFKIFKDGKFLKQIPASSVVYGLSIGKMWLYLDLKDMLVKSTYDKSLTVYNLELGTFSGDSGWLATTSPLQPPSIVYTTESQIGSATALSFEKDDLHLYWYVNKANLYFKELKVNNYAIQVLDEHNEVRGGFTVKPDPKGGGSFDFSLSDNVRMFGNTGARKFGINIYSQDQEGYLSAEHRSLLIENPKPKIIRFDVVRAFESVLAVVTEVEGPYTGFTFYQMLDGVIVNAQTVTENSVNFTAPTDVYYDYVVRARDSYGEGDLSEVKTISSASLTPDSYIYAGLMFVPHPSSNTVSWGNFTASKNGENPYTVPGDTLPHTGGILYLYLDPISRTVKGDTDLTKAVKGRILGTYKGGSDVTADAGKAFIDKDQILAGSIGATHMTSDVVITSMAQIGDIVQSENFHWGEGGYHGWRLDRSGAAKFGSIDVRSANGSIILSNEGSPDTISIDFSKIVAPSGAPEIPQPGATKNIHRGLYSPATLYHPGEMVNDTEGNSWSCIVGGSGLPLPTDQQSNSNWGIFSKAGVTKTIYQTLPGVNTIETKTIYETLPGVNTTVIQPANYITVSSETVFKYQTGSLTPTQSSITLTATLFGTATGYVWSYKSGSSYITFTNLPNAPARNGKSTFTIFADDAAWNGMSVLTIRCETSGGAYDEQTITKLYDGAAGKGSSVDIVFTRAIGIPNGGASYPDSVDAPLGWFTDPPLLTSVQRGFLWSMTGYKASDGTVYKWTLPVRIEGAQVAEVSLFTRNAAAVKPASTTYTFGVANPLAAIGDWSPLIPSSPIDAPLWISKAVASAPAGMLLPVTVTGWSTPVISSQSGVNGTLSDNPVQVECLASGIPISLVGKGGKFDIYSGTTKVNVGNSVIYTPATQTIAGLTLSISSTGVFTATTTTSWTDNVTVFTVKASYNNAIIEKQITFVKLLPNVATPILSILNTSPAFKKSEDGTTYPTQFILKTRVEHLQNVTYLWKDDLGDTVGTSATLTVTAASYGSKESRSFTCNASGLFGNAQKTLEDTITIPYLKDGSSTLSFLVSNERIELQGPSEGFSGINFDNSAVTVGVNIGLQQLNYQDLGGGANTYKFIAEPIGISFAGGTSSIVADSLTDIITVPDISGITSDSAKLKLTITPRDASGTDLPSTIKYIYYLVNRPYAIAPVVNIQNSSVVFTKNSLAEVSPKKSVLTAIADGFQGTVLYKWFEEGSNVVLQSRTTSDFEINSSDFLAKKTFSISYRCEVHGTYNGNSNHHVSDTATISLLESGGTGPTVLISNESISLQAGPGADNFTGIDTTGKVVQVTAYLGDKRLEYKSTGAFTFTVTKSFVGLTISSKDILRESGRVLEIQAPSYIFANDAYMVLTVTIRNSTGVSIDPIVKTVRYPLSRAGIPGLAQFITLTPSVVVRQKDQKLSTSSVLAELKQTASSGIQNPFKGLLVSTSVFLGGTDAIIHTGSSDSQLSIPIAGSNLTNVSVEAYAPSQSGDITLRTWIRFSGVANPTTSSQISKLPIVGKTAYYGIAFNRLSSDVPSDNPLDYIWQLAASPCKQPTSLTGVDLFTWVDFRNTVTKGTITDAPTIGQQAVRFSFNQATNAETEKSISKWYSLNSASIPASAGKLSRIATNGIVISNDGIDTYNVTLSRPSIVLYATILGVVSNDGLADSGTLISATEGSKELVFDGVGTARGTFTVTASASEGIEVYSTLKKVGNKGEASDIRSISDIQLGGLITFTVKGTLLSGISFNSTLEQTVKKILQGPTGIGGYVINNPNESHSFSVDADGNIGVGGYNGSGTTIRVYHLDTPLTYVGPWISGNPNITKPNEFRILAKASNIQMSLPVTATNGGVIIGDMSGMSGATASVLYTIKAVSESGNPIELSTQQSFSKSVSVGGKGAATVQITCDSKFGTVFPHKDSVPLVLKASKSGFTTAAKVTWSVAKNSPLTLSGDIAGDTITIAESQMTGNSAVIICTVTEGTSTAIDTETISKLGDPDAISGIVFGPEGTPGLTPITGKIPANLMETAVIGTAHIDRIDLHSNQFSLNRDVTTGGRMVIDGDLLTIVDGNGVTRVKLGKLS